MPPSDMDRKKDSIMTTLTYYNASQISQYVNNSVIVHDKLINN